MASAFDPIWKLPPWILTQFSSGQAPMRKQGAKTQLAEFEQQLASASSELQATLVKLEVTQRESDEKLSEYFLGLMETYCGKHNAAAAIPRQHRELLAKFIGVCDPGKEKTNSHRYNDILKFATHYGDVLLTGEIADCMCELHCAIQNASKNLKDPNDPHIRDMTQLMHARLSWP